MWDFKEIRVFLEKYGHVLVAVTPGEVRRANKCGDAGGQRRWGISAVLLPTFLLGGRPMPNEKPGPGLYHWIRIEISECAGFP